MDNAKSSLIAAIIGLAWPALIGALLWTYRTTIRALLDIGLARLRRGDELRIGIVTIGQAVGPLKEPTPGALVTDDHLALIHRSWRAPQHDAGFGGAKMFQIHVIVFGTAEALNKIEYVVYRLDPAYPRPVQVADSLHTQFELKELANGYSLIRAEVHVKEQGEPVYLSQFIDLTHESPPLKGTYQFLIQQT